MNESIRDYNKETFKRVDVLERSFNDLNESLERNKKRLHKLYIYYNSIYDDTIKQGTIQTSKRRCNKKISKT